MSLETIASVILGAIIGAAINWYFSRQSSKELERQTDRLRQMLNTLGRAFEVLTQDLKPGARIEFRRDPETGDILSRLVTIEAGGGQIAPSGDLTVTKLTREDS
jgi:uncharacterized membrane protein YccC